MKISGIDFTSSPSRKKPLTCARCELTGNQLRFIGIEAWSDFDQFEADLASEGPWVAGIDFPFGQARRFVETIGWPQTWAEYALHAASLGREGFVAALEAYKADRAPGDKEHRRKCDTQTGSISPQKLYGVPVGKMFFEGAPRLAASNVHIPGLKSGDPERIVVEAYPGVLARFLVGKASYKSDTARKQSPEQLEVRKNIIAALRSHAFVERYALDVDAPASLADDPSGDELDSLLCAVQAAWAFTQRANSFGMPDDFDPLEGWIAHPATLGIR